MKLNEINYDLSTPRDIEIKNPTTGLSFDKPAFISVYSIESKQGKLVKHGLYRDVLEFKKNNETITDEDIKQLTIKHIAGLVAGWNGIEDDDGKDIEYSPEKAVEVLQNYDIIYNTVDTSSSILGNFLKV